MSLYDKINYLYDAILKIENETRTSLASHGYIWEGRIPQEQLDFSVLYPELKGILAPMLDEYKVLLRTSIADRVKKVFFVAICEMVKQDFTRGMLITFRYVTQQDINTNRYYDLLSIVSKDQGMLIPVVNDRRLFEEAYVLETGIPRNLSKYVIKLFNIYWRYFRTFMKGERLEIIHEYLRGNDFQNVYILNPQDYDLLESYRKYLQQFPEKAIRVLDRLDDIFEALDSYPLMTTDKEKKYEFAEIISKQVGYDITCVLRDSDMENIYYSYLNKMPIRKFMKIIKNLPQDEEIVLPTKRVCQAKNISEKSLCYGIYKIRKNQYEVIADPTISLFEMAHAKCDTVIRLATDYYMYVSDYEYEVIIDGIIQYPRKIVFDKISRYIWIGKLGPATTAEIDGHIVVSEQKIRIHGKLIKCYDYVKKENRLQYCISSIKINCPESKYGKLEYSLNNCVPELISVGSPQGVFYRENLRIDLDGFSSNHKISFLINGNLIQEIDISLENYYLFDKWQGSLYSDKGTNDNNSGSLVLFTKEGIDYNDFKYFITNQYKWDDYTVIEFKADTRSENLLIGNHEYVFGKAKHPYFSFQSETGVQEIIDNLELLCFRVFNVGEEQGLWISIENEYEKYKFDAYDGTYKFSDIFTREQLSITGNWSCSLWNHQKKVDEYNFKVLPNLHINQANPCILEGKEIQLEIVASEECFSADNGEYSKSIKINVGSATISIEGDSISPQIIETYVYLDKFDAMKTIIHSPAVWGMRSNNKEECRWKKEDVVNINANQKNDTQIAIFSTGYNTVYINGQECRIQPGKNLISWHHFLTQIRNKNELIVTDGRHSFKQIIGCMPKYSFKAIEVNEDVIVTINYSGPIAERLNIRGFINGLVEHVFSREALKNNFDIHVHMGKAVSLYDKRIVIDIATDRAGIPIVIYDSILEKRDVDTNADICDVREEKEVTIKKVEPIQEIKLQELGCYVEIPELLEWYYQKKNKSQLEINVDNLRDYYWSNSNENTN